MEDLNKSIDTLIDELFADESVEKSMIKDDKPAKETADEAVAQAPKSEKDESRDAGRPKQISDVPQKDTDGDRSGEYDGKIAHKQEDAKKKEDTQVQPPAMMKKSVEVSTEDFEEYQALKKAKAAAAQTEELKKARQDQIDLIKSAVVEATSGIKAENEELKKSLKEQGEILKAIANKPRQSKAITSVQAVEKFQKSSTGGNQLSKSELLDVAEELVKSKKLTMEHAIELENNGFIYESEARQILEREVAKRYR